MNLLELCLVLLAGLVIFQFWQLRAIAEYSVKQAEAYCEKNRLQFVSLARTSTKFKAYKGRLNWQVTYSLCFSSDGETEYEGEIICHGAHLIKVDLPAHRILETN